MSGKPRRMERAHPSDASPGFTETGHILADSDQPVTHNTDRAQLGSQQAPALETDSAVQTYAPDMPQPAPQRHNRGRDSQALAERRAAATARVEARIAEAVVQAPPLPPDLQRRLRELIVLSEGGNPVT